MKLEGLSTIEDLIITPKQMKLMRSNPRFLAIKHIEMGYGLYQRSFTENKLYEKFLPDDDIDEIRLMYILLDVVVKMRIATFGCIDIDNHELKLITQIGAGNPYFLLINKFLNPKGWEIVERRWGWIFVSYYFRKKN